MQYLCKKITFFIFYELLCPQFIFVKALLPLNIQLSDYLYPMKKTIFKILAHINKAILPKYYQRDLKNLKKWEMAIVAYKYWVTINSID